MNTKNKLLVGYLCAIGCECLYGISYVFTKDVTGTVSPMALLGWRFLVAFLVMSICAAVGIVKINLKGKSIRHLLLLALFSPVLYFIGETIGINNTTASESGIILACIPVAALIASTIILRKKPTRMQIVGILVTLVGALITVIAVGITASFSIIGYLFLLLAVVACAFYCVCVEKATDYSAAEITYIMLAAGAVVFVIVAFIEAIINKDVVELLTLPMGNVDFLIAVLYQGIGCSVLAFFLNNMAIARIGVNRASTLVGISTIVSIVAGALILGEQLSLFQIVGAVIIILGVCIANVTWPSKKQG